ncbi:multiple pdz domain protein [Holotrichia oblita]|uniref:Multiple pdz domain protein n=2 Tax=Holotrichia oblita TaxID=644536 RepID=A0ACB9SND1_HOLOL|nr:multiple pdz domain protein [Holotrichia oblita]KAI4456713.1 multiple pdz domain protein [Holotrichia oblita]
MSVSDPLIKDIKGCILAFLEEIKINHCISDSNSILLLFCQCLEKILNLGLVPVYNTFGFCKYIDPWVWLEKIIHDKNADISYNYLHCVENIKLCRNVITNIGKLRLLIRLCLIHRCLHIPIEYLKNYKKLNVVYKENSIIGDEILCEIFLSVLRQCSKINFKLNANNTSFLDLSWSMPELIKLEYVPCETLGMTVSFAGEKAIIMSIQPNSVASECGKIEVGDVLDSLNGVQICAATKGRLRTIFKGCKGRPIVLTIIKAVYSDTRQIYLPIISLLRHVRLDPDVLKSRIDSHYTKTDDHFSSKNNSCGTGLKVTYMGCVQVGSRGDVKQIDKAVSNFLAPAISLTCDDSFLYEKVKKVVSFELGELGVRCVDPISSEIILKHSYMEISACGSVSTLQNYFAYIAG